MNSMSFSQHSPNGIAFIEWMKPLAVRLWYGCGTEWHAEPGLPAELLLLPQT